MQGMASHGVACSRRSRALYDLRNALSSVDELDELVTGLVVGSRAAREGATSTATRGCVRLYKAFVIYARGDVRSYI